MSNKNKILTSAKIGATIGGIIGAGIMSPLAYVVAAFSFDDPRVGRCPLLALLPAGCALAIGAIPGAIIGGLAGASISDFA